MIRFGLKALLFLILVGGPTLLIMSTRSSMLQEPEEYRNFTNHQNGWCEVTVKHMKPKPKIFRPGFELELLPSDKRLGYLGKTIDWLDDRGR